MCCHCVYVARVYARVSVYMHLCVCACMQVWPEIDVRSLPQFPSMLISEAGFLMEPGAHYLARLAGPRAVVTCLCCPNTDVCD